MNCEAVVKHLVTWLQEKVHDAGALGVTLGVSGGIDSAVAAVLAKKAFPNNCIAIILPCESSVQDLIDSQLLLETFEIPYRVSEIDSAYQLIMTKNESFIKMDGDLQRLVRANLKTRLRMINLYYSAQARNYLVLGTTNKSEMTIGYTTKYGDSAVDIQILGDLVKREIYELARYLKIPEVIINKCPSAGLWLGQTDENEMGFSYNDLDDYIQYGKGDPEIVKRIEMLNKRSEHKRQMPPIALIPEELRK
ncbi:MAG: NAD(+) synthase [Syntrophomonadaceae bacterium]|jgi:NAD+ synthase